MTSSPNRRRIAAVAAASALVALGACSGQDSMDNGAPTVASDESAGDGDAALQVPGAPPVPTAGDEVANSAYAAALRSIAGEAAESGGDGKATSIELPTLESPDLIKTAQVSIVEEDLAEARDVIDNLLRKYGGAVADEKTVNDVKGKTETSTLVIRVPSRSFSGMMNDLNEGLNVKTSVTDTEDVHTQVIDVESRLANLRVSLGRLRSFLRDASDLNAMLQFEQRITNVESQIASLTAQREYLNDQTTMSTITLDLRTPTAPPPPKPKEDDPLEDAGFFTGLDNGWQALKDVLLVAAT
ncbi:MAG TPA: DUF4349 domain-containing protein, partial [Nocardioidaceae bacterium]|nr:DUF4349 domain-containing protein [Nocardioidaceae bacterium]